MKMMLNLMHSADCMMCNTTIKYYSSVLVIINYHVYNYIKLRSMYVHLQHQILFSVFTIHQVLLLYTFWFLR